MIHSLPTTKTALLLSVAALAHRVYPAPTSPPKPEAILRFQLYDPLSIGVRIMPIVGPPIVWTSTVCEILASFLAGSGPSTSLSQSLLSFLTFGTPPAARNLHTSRLFLAGWLMAVLGGALRIMCYRQLGPQFTYRLTISDTHRLVTDGPYAVVRHPSYAAWIVFAFGMTLVQMSPGSWVVECGLLELLAGKAIVAAWVVFNLRMIMSIPMRMRQEDKAMKQHFGEQWARWASVTPYKLIPGLY